MKLNKSKLIYVLKNLEYPSVSKKRSWDTMYNNKTTTFWNNLLWNAILEDSNLIGESIDRYEFYNFCDYYCNNDNANRIFNSINNKSRCIHLNEFEEYLEKLDNKDYINILKCLSAYNGNIQSGTEINIKPIIESEVELEVESEIKIEPMSEVEPESESEIIIELQEELNYEVKHESESEIIIEPPEEVNYEVKSESEPMPDPEPDLEVDLLPQPKVKVQEKDTFLKKWCNYNYFINNIKKMFFKTFY